MQYLQMAQKVRQLVGMQGTGPTSVDATGADAVFLTVVRDAWTDIQNRRKDWKWMRDTITFQTVVGTSTYTPATIFGPVNRFKSWYKESMYITKDSKKHWTPFVEYNYYDYKHINDSVNTPPSEFSIRPKDYALCISKPDLIYPVQIDYKKSNQTLSLATDTPEMPSDYHNLIVYEAIARYAISIAIGHVYQEYSQKAAELWGDLLREQNPRTLFKVRGIA